MSRCRRWSFQPNRRLPCKERHGSDPGHCTLQVPAPLGSSGTAAPSYGCGGPCNWQGQGLHKACCQSQPRLCHVHPEEADKVRKRKSRETQEKAEKAEAVLSSVMLLDNKPGTDSAKHPKKPKGSMLLLLGQPGIAFKTVCTQLTGQCKKNAFWGLCACQLTCCFAGWLHSFALCKVESHHQQIVYLCRAWQQVRAFMDNKLLDILTSNQQQTSCSDHPLPQPDHPYIPSTAFPDHHASLSSASARTAAVRLLRSVLSALPKEEVLEILVARSSPTNCCSTAAPACVSPAAAASFLNELHSTEIYRVVQQCFPESKDVLQTDVCSTSDSHSESVAISGPQAALDGQSKDFHASSSHNQLIGLSKGILTYTEQSLSPEVDNLPRNDLCISAAEPLAAINDLACKASSAHTDSAEFVSAKLPSTTISSCCHQQPSESESREATQKQRQQSSNSLNALQSLAIRSAAVDADADSLGSMTVSMSQHAKQVYGVEALCMFLLITDGVWSLVKDVQVGATAFFGHDCRLSFHASTVMALAEAMQTVLSLYSLLQFV